MSSEKWYCDCDRCNPFKHDFTALGSDILSGICSSEGKVTIFLQGEGGLQMVASRPRSNVRLRLVPVIELDDTEKGPFWVPLDAVFGVEIQGAVSDVSPIQVVLRPDKEFRPHRVTVLYLRNSRGELTCMEVRPDSLR